MADWKYCETNYKSKLITFTLLLHAFCLHIYKNGLHKDYLQVMIVFTLCQTDFYHLNAINKENSVNVFLLTAYEAIKCSSKYLYVIQFNICDLYTQIIGIVTNPKFRFYSIISAPPILSFLPSFWKWWHFLEWRLKFNFDIKIHVVLCTDHEYHNLFWLKSIRFT